MYCAELWSAVKEVAVICDDKERGGPIVMFYDQDRLRMICNDKRGGPVVLRGSNIAKSLYMMKEKEVL
jgi:hypothetical protein